MISAKNFLIYGLLCLAACSSPKKETAGTVDSIKTDSIVTKSTTSDEGVAFDVDPSIESQELTLFGKNESVVYWLARFYDPDHFIDRKKDMVNAPGYLIKSVELIDNDYSDAKGKCVSMPILLVLRIKDGEEHYDVNFLTHKDDVLPDRISYDGSIAQTTGSVSLSNDYKLAEGCTTLAITRSYEGGDIDYGRMKELSLFIYTESGMVSVFDLVLEDMLAREYEVTGDESKNSTSEVRHFEILDTKTNGLRDIKVHTVIKKDGEVTEEKDTLFHFNGEKYSE